MWILIAAALIGVVAFASGQAKGGAHPLPPPPAPGPVPPPAPVPVPSISPTPAQPGVLPVSPITPPVPIDPNSGATLTVTTASTGAAGDLHVRSTPDASSDANILGTVPHGALVRPDTTIGWPDASGNLSASDPSGNFIPSTGWYHITDVNNQGSPPGVSGFASAAFLSVG
jgi:hypothetical protein